MFESLRIILYPLLGAVAQGLFSLRFFIQWIKSEKKQQSYVSKQFWILSLIATCCLTLHGLIQQQFPVVILSTLNGVIAYRNLEMFQAKQRSSLSLVLLFALPLFFCTSLYLIEAYFLNTLIWMRSPMFEVKLSGALHFFGISGMVLFASRFWIQWFFAEKHQKSFCHPSFWYLSVIGGVLSTVYFIFLKDIVNFLGYSIGLIPYVRNIMLISKKKYPLKPDSLFCFAPEHSSDLLASDLIEKLPKNLEIQGVYGDTVECLGLQSLLPASSFRIMGFSQVIMHLYSITKHFFFVRNYILEQGFSTVCFIDYPDFSMRLAKSLRKKGYQGKIIQYVSPTVWAWRKNRIYTLEKYFDAVLSIFPFEKDYYARVNLDLFYVGHPLVKTLEKHHYEPIKSTQPILALFPGSRYEEITRNLKLQLQASQAFKDHALFISLADPKYKPLIEKLAMGHTYTLIDFSNRYNLMQSANLSFATCGTVTLELALHGVPTVVTYRLSLLNAVIARFLLRLNLPFYCIVNIIENKSIFPEHIYPFLNPNAIIKSAQDLLNNREMISKTALDLRKKLAGDLNPAEALDPSYAMSLSQ